MKKSYCFLIKILSIILSLGVMFTVTGCKKNDDKDKTSSLTISYTGGIPNLGLDESSEDSPIEDSSKDNTQHNSNSESITPNKTVPLNKEYNFKAPLLTGDKSLETTDNPNRGFRLETYMSVENRKYTPQMYDEKGNYYPEKGTDAIGWLYKYFDDYDFESPRIAQVYFYLTQYKDRDFDTIAINNMNTYFEACRKLKITVALRFAYIVTQGVLSQDCVSLYQMQRHMSQLKPILEKNRDVLFCLESGFMGEWGEQSEICSWRKNGQTGDIMNSIINMVPSDLWVLARYASVRDEASASNQKRIGYHNDYIVGVSHEWDSGGVWTSQDYKNLVTFSENALVEGEMPWGWQTPFQIDGWNVAKYLKTNHFTTLSCYHNNREGGSIYDLKKWREIKIDSRKLNQVGLPYYSEWFKNSKGDTISRNLYEYIRDYLGYNIFVSNSVVSSKNNIITASFSMKNVGFAAPVAMKQLRAVLIDEKGKIVDSKDLCSVYDLKSGVQKKFSISLKRPNNNVYRLGLFLEAPNGVGAKLANNLELINGINILGSIN